MIRTAGLGVCTLTFVLVCALPHAPRAVQQGPPVRVRIATQSPLSGRSKVQGEGLMLAVKLAVDQLGGVLSKLGLAVEVVSFDDRGETAVGVDEAHRIVADAGTLAVVGPMNSDVALRVAGIYRDADLAMITPSSTHPALTERGLPNVFRMCGRDDVQTDVAARFIEKSLRAKTVYVVHDATTYGRANAEAFREATRRRRLTIVAFEAVPNKADVGRVVAAVSANAPDVLYFAGGYELAGSLLKEGRRSGMTAKFLGSDGVDSSALLEGAGAATEGAYFTSVAGAVSVHPQARGFAYDYWKQFGKNPEPFAVQAFDAAAVVLQALAKASKGQVPPTRQAVIAAMRDTRYMGFSGPIAFDQRGDLRRALYLVMKVTATDPDDWGDNRELKRFGIPPPGRKGRIVRRGE